MRNELSQKERWGRIAGQIRKHGLPKRGRPKKVSVDTDINRLPDALLIRAERAIAELKLNDRQRSYLICVLRSRLRSNITLAESTLIAPKAIAQLFTRIAALSPPYSPKATPYTRAVTHWPERSVAFVGGEAWRVRCSSRFRGGVHLILANPPWRQLQERAEKIPGDKKHVKGILSQSQSVAQFNTAHKLPSNVR